MGCSNSKIEAPVVASDVVMYDVPTTPPPSAPPGDEAISFAGNLGTYGKCKFKGKVAAKYLKTVGLSADAMDGPWNKTEAIADKVAAAMLKWAQDQGEPPRPLRCCHRAQNACLLAQGRTRLDTVALVRGRASGAPVALAAPRMRTSPCTLASARHIPRFACPRPSAPLGRRDDGDARLPAARLHLHAPRTGRSGP